MTQQGIDKKSTKFRSISEIMSVPSFKAKLSNLADEAVECHTKIETQRQNIKVLRDAAVDDLGMKPDMFNAYVKMMFNNDYAKRLDNVEQLHDMITTVMKDSQIEYSKDE